MDKVPQTLPPNETAPCFKVIYGQVLGLAFFDMCYCRGVETPQQLRWRTLKASTFEPYVKARWSPWRIFRHQLL